MAAFRSGPAATSLRAICVASALLVQSPAAAAASDPGDVVGAIAKSLDLQTEMPVDKVEPKQPAPAWSNAHWHIPGDIAQWILWSAIALAVGFALFALRDTLPGLSRRDKKRRARGAAKILPLDKTAERLAEAGEDADDLARRGLFADAMHLLLLRALAELRRRLDVTISDALTSREVLASLVLPDLGRHALGDLIGRVELVHFGKRDAAREDYGACRASFDDLIGAMRDRTIAAA